MKAIARLIWTYLTAFPILRWVGVVGLASLPFALLAIWPGPRSWLGLPIIALSIHSLSMAMAMGYLLRVLSSPRSHRFLPHFRGRSLAAFLVIVAVVSAPWLVLAAWAGQTAYPPYAVSMVLPVALVLSIFVGLAFFPIGAFVTFALLVAIGWVVTHPAAQSGVITAPHYVITFGPVAVAAFLLGVMVALWVAFSIWYLRVPQIEPIQTPAMIITKLVDKLGFKPGSAVFDRRRAVAASLAANYPRASKETLVAVAVLVLVTMNATAVARASHLVFTAPILVPALVIPGVVLAAIATTVARRARSLWLKSGLSRRDLLAVTEGQIWRTAALRSIAASVVLATGFALAYDTPVAVLARGLVSAVATAVLALYLGLAHVRDSRLMEAFTAALVIASAGFALWAAFSQPAKDGVWLGTIVAQVAAALLCRTVAIARWRRIDWLVFRPARVASQSLR